jgi:transposase
MIKTCEKCGTRENIQTHHLCYDPEITQYLCVKCHQKAHGNKHGVGSVGFKGTNAGLLSDLREEIIMLCEAEATNKEIAKSLGVSKVTASRWKETLGFKGVGKRIIKPKKAGSKRKSLRIGSKRKMANRYIRQDLERRMILLGLDNKEIANFINDVISEKLNREKKEETVPVGSMTERPSLSLVSPQGEEST